jgi:hypothetical protein
VVRSTALFIDRKKDPSRYKEGTLVPNNFSRQGQPPSRLLKLYPLRLYIITLFVLKFTAHDDNKINDRPNTQAT